MASNRISDKQNFQLYSLLNKLSLHIEDDDELGMILSYSIIDSLTDFNSNSGSNEEIKFEEIKRVYYSIEKIVECYLNNENYNAVLELQSKVEPLLNRIIKEERKEKLNSSLLERIMDKIKEGNKKNYEDIFRRTGMKLNNEVNFRGPYYRNIDMLKNDYKAIEKSFDL
jgi:hypothetical protein